jgi:hypothetical protein
MSVRWQGKDVTDTGLDASLGIDFDDVVITLTGRAAEILGVVRDRGVGVPAAVIAFPVDRARWTNYGVQPRIFRTTRAGATGTYRISGVVAGEYLLIAADLTQINAWTDPRFLAAAAPQATKVSIAWGDKKTQDLTLSSVVVK